MSDNLKKSSEKETIIDVNSSAQSKTADTIDKKIENSDVKTILSSDVKNETDKPDVKTDEKTSVELNPEMDYESKTEDALIGSKPVEVEKSNKSQAIQEVSQPEKESKLQDTKLHSSNSNSSSFKINRVLLFLSTLAILFLALWLIGSLYLASQSSKMIFRPERTMGFFPFSGYERYFVKNKAGQNLSMWYIPNPSSDKVILYLHGNSGRLVHLFPDMTEGASVLSPAYPGYHESEGWPNTKNAYETAELAYNWLVNEQQVKEENIIIFGHSMGGSPAVYLASKKPNASKLILVNVFSSISSMCWSQYSIFCTFSGSLLPSTKYAGDIKIPVRQFAYKNDTVVPFKEGEKLFEKIGSSDKKFTELEGDTHSYFDLQKVLNEK